MADDDDIPEIARRSIAAQFFTLFGKQSLGEMHMRVGKAVSKQTIARDREKVLNREAPSLASTRAYAAALDRGDGLDTANPDDLADFVDAVVEARMHYWGAQPLSEHITDSHAKFPRIFDRLYKRIGDRQWTAVIDIIETFMESEDPEKWRDAMPYLEFYLGMAYRNLGNTRIAADHFAKSYKAIQYTNSDTDMKSHAAINHALAIQELPRWAGRETDITDLLQVALDNLPDDHPETLVNILIAASRLSDQWFGFFAGQVHEVIVNSSSDFDWKFLHSSFVEQDDLKDYQKNDMLQKVIHAVEVRLAEFQKG